jgi:hypothetical protein
MAMIMRRELTSIGNMSFRMISIPVIFQTPAPYYLSPVTVTTAFSKQTPNASSSPTTLKTLHKRSSTSIDNNECSLTHHSTPIQARRDG